ncbi:MAG: hypothetical protein ACE5DU_01040 [Nitrosopumilus sp.]
MKPIRTKKFPPGRFSSSLLMQTKQIKNSDSINSQYENEIMLDEFDFFIHQQNPTSHLSKYGAST